MSPLSSPSCSAPQDWYGTLPPPHATVLAVSRSPRHEFSKRVQDDGITLLAGLGVEGDCHAGESVQHRSRLGIRPRPRNLRQVHLVMAELLAEMGGLLRARARARARAGGEVGQVGEEGKEGGSRTSVGFGGMGENVTTAGVDLLALTTGTKLRFVEATAVPLGGDGEVAEVPTVVVTGLRNPCPQIEKAFGKEVLEICRIRDAEGKIVGRRAGIMATVEVGGVVRAGMRILVEEPKGGEGVGGQLVCV